MVFTRKQNIAVIITTARSNWVSEPLVFNGLTRNFSNMDIVLGMINFTQSRDEFITSVETKPDYIPIGTQSCKNTDFKFHLQHFKYNTMANTI